MSDLSHISTPRCDQAHEGRSERYLGGTVDFDFARQLERELAVCERQRDELLAKERPTDATPEGLIYRYNHDRAFHELVDRLAYDKFQSHLQK